jgi:predicted DNA-binding transcriptional regulator AlpA
VQIQDSTVLIDSDALLISAEKLAQMLDISIRTLWRLRAAGKMPAPVRLGGSVRWRAEEIQTWINRGCPEQRKSRAGSGAQKTGALCNS